jgi:hypothetical protein
MYVSEHRRNRAAVVDTVLIEKLSLHYLREVLPLMESEDSLLCSQLSATESYFEPDESNLHPHTLH